MSHPVLNVPRRVGEGMLTSVERLDVEQAFAEALASQPNPQSLIEAIFLTHAKSILLELRFGGTARDIAAFTLTSCLLSRWTCSPALLEMLLEYLVTAKGHGAFAAILGRVQRGVDPNSSAYASSWLLDNSRPFFNRHHLRHHVRLLIEQNGRPILQVPTDGKGYGRSYSLRFLEHLENCRPDDVHVLAASVSEGAAPSYQVEDLLALIGAQLGNMGSLPERTRSSYLEAAALWLLGQLMSTGHLWVFVLDGFGQPQLHPEVHGTIQSLAYHVTTAQFRRRIRLVLLDYPHPLPKVSPADILTETLPPAANICRADLMPCLESWDDLRRQRGLVGVALCELYKLADGMLTKAPAEGKDRLEALNAELVKLLDLPGGGLDGAI